MIDESSVKKKEESEVSFSLLLLIILFFPLLLRFLSSCRRSVRLQTQVPEEDERQV